MGYNTITAGIDRGKPSLRAGLGSRELEWWWLLWWWIRTSRTLWGCL